jgi:hypothetical protein
MNYDDEINAGPEIVIFGQPAEHGLKVPSSQLHVAALEREQNELAAGRSRTARARLTASFNCGGRFTIGAFGKVARTRRRSRSATRTARLARVDSGLALRNT